MWRDKKWERSFWDKRSVDLPGERATDKLPRLTIRAHVTNPFLWTWQRKPFVSETALSLDSHPHDNGRKQVGFTVAPVVAYFERSVGGGLYSSLQRSHTKRNYALKIGVLNVDVTIKVHVPIWEAGRMETLFARDLWVRKNAAIDEALAAVGCTHDRRGGPSGDLSRKPLHEEPIQVNGEVQLRRYVGSFHCWQCLPLEGSKHVGQTYYFTDEFMKFLNSRAEDPHPVPTHVETHVIPMPRRVHA